MKCFCIVALNNAGIMNELQLSVSRLIRTTGLAEGISYLVLLIVAMPLKYVWHIPEAVKYTGWIHGVLFIAFLYMILQGRVKLNWSMQQVITAFASSLIPFGTFWLDGKLKQEEVK